MSRISRLVVLVTSLAALVGAMAGTAGAVTWHVSGSGAFDATAPASTLGSTGANFVCTGTGATAAGSFTAGTFAGPVYSGISGRINITGCLLATQHTFVTCGYTLTATTQPTVTTVTTGSVDLTCGMTPASIPTTELCHFGGAVHAIYHDRPSGADTLTLTTTSTLLVSGVGCPFGSNDTMHLNAYTFSVVSNGGNGPHISRTA